ncbi:unnamed protein product [Medioppia subpectinata]|uniref:Carbohydrate kinase PfkB domain-containing protein n=1 Tax=Medioppia subpectinata TaxID=1979941 RepID=A0A7R9KXK6_9ACAR|nr:unnamed protein product [Medioppia subpectinata]CAG2110597.1 unnamed protein product [Medioppia subpectinata]
MLASVAMFKSSVYLILDGIIVWKDTNLLDIYCEEVMETMDEKRNRILFVGLSCLDMVYVCNHFPEEDSDQRAVYNAWRRGGNASNNSTALMQLLKWKSCHDYEVEFFGTIAHDFPSDFLIKDFNENGIKIENIVRYEESQCPASTVIINAENGSRTIVHFNKNLPELKCESFSKLCFNKYKAIHFEGLRNVSEIRKMIAYVRQKDLKREIKISVELERAVDSLKDLLNDDIDIFFVEREFAKLMNYNTLEETINGIAERVQPNALVICPWGESGAQAIDNTDKRIHSSPAFTPKTGVQDTLGAGDTFLSATLFGLYALNYGLKEAIVLGCQVAGAKCGALGFQHLHQFEQYI